MVDIVYKYMVFREEFFSNKWLRFTPRRHLNDPFEIRPPFSLHAEYVHRVNGYGESVSAVIEEMENNQELYLEGIVFSDFDIYGVLSMSERNDNLLMWSHYAQDHKGLAIGLDPNHDFFDGSKSPKEYVRKAVNEHIGVLKRVRYSGKRNIVGENLDEYFFLKSNDWWTEREVRFVLPIAEADEIDNSNPREPMAFYRVPDDAIVSVTFGLKVLLRESQRVIAKVRSESCNSHIKFFQSKMCNETFELKIEPIDA